MLTVNTDGVSRWSLMRVRLLYEIMHRRVVFEVRDVDFGLLFIIHKGTTKVVDANGAILSQEIFLRRDFDTSSKRNAR